MKYGAGRKPAGKGGRRMARSSMPFYSTLDAAAGRPLTTIPRGGTNWRIGMPRQAHPRMGFRVRRRLGALLAAIAAYRPGPRTFSLVVLLLCAGALYLFADSDDFYVQNVA